MVYLSWFDWCLTLHGMSTHPKNNPINCSYIPAARSRVGLASPSFSPGYTTEQILEELHQKGPWAQPGIGLWRLHWGTSDEHVEQT